MNAISKRNLIVVSALIVAVFSLFSVYAMSLSSSQPSRSRAGYVDQEAAQVHNSGMNPLRLSKPLP